MTAYIESGAGVAAGAGRTGLARLITAGLFVLSLFLHPLVRMIGGGYAVGAPTLYPVIAPPLILVGTMMIGGLRHIAWDDPTEAIPAFLTVILMPLVVSITEGVAFGVIARRAEGRDRAPPRNPSAPVRVCGSVRRALRVPQMRRKCYDVLL